MTHRTTLLSPRAASLLCASAAMSLASLAHAQDFQLESALIESTSGRNLGVVREQGALPSFFQSQKAMVFGILRSSGIALESLPLDVRQKLEKFQTSNLEAFKAYAQGLDLMDDGKFAEAKTFFDKALELDPDFELAKEKKQAMPDLNLENTLQIRSAVMAHAKTSVDSGKKQVEVDLSRALAALQSGQDVVIGQRESSRPNTETDPFQSADYTSNPPGSADNFLPRKAVGTAYTIISSEEGIAIGIAATSEWTQDQFRGSAGGLTSLGSPGALVASRGGATDIPVGTHRLADGSAVYWGTWKSTPGASASVTVSGNNVSAPTLGSDFHYMVGDATRQMPTAGSVTFSPTAGFLNSASGNITVNFATRNVQINNLGYSLGALTFAGLNGNTTYGAQSGSGFFKGNFNSGTCTGCAAFSANASAFSGNFVGETANGVIFSNIMQTGSGTVSGTHLFTR